MYSDQLVSPHTKHIEVWRQLARGLPCNSGTGWDKQISSYKTETDPANTNLILTVFALIHQPTSNIWGNGIRWAIALVRKMSTSQVPLIHHLKQNADLRWLPTDQDRFSTSPKTIGPGLPTSRRSAFYPGCMAQSLQAKLIGTFLQKGTDQFVKRSRSIYKVIGTSFYALWNSIYFSMKNVRKKEW